MDNFLIDAQPFINQILLAILSVASVFVIRLLGVAKTYVATKIGATNYNRAREIAMGIWVLLEDEIQGAGAMGAKKKAIMEELITEKFPSLTQTELDAINKEVHQIWKLELEKEGLADPVEVTINEPVAVEPTESTEPTHPTPPIFSNEHDFDMDNETDLDHSDGPGDFTTEKF